ncbi:hypothetical protein [Dyadobacter sp. MSC1_007]|jgi:hypothetical protein|uniref:hypothetical protein n=1 Tax=Dyadobacter sp. MSC1_007 TaxID=2909264 RepID=UPI00202E47E2|nr:hypothetical protein [Dyadobacter sp. MSC1_007]
MESQNIRVNSLVTLLSQYDPSALSTIKKSHISSAYETSRREGIEKILTPGLTLGESDVGDSKLYLEVAIKGLTVARTRIGPNILRLRERLGKAKKIRLIGQIVAAVTSVGLISALFAKKTGNLTIATAIINFAGILCTLIANGLETPSHGGSGNLIQLFEVLAKTDVESELLLQELEVMSEINSSKEVIRAKVAQANALANILLNGERMLWA